MSRRPTSEVINAAFGSTSDEIGLQLDEATRWLNDIVEQPYEQSRIKKKYCEICSASSCAVMLLQIAGEQRHHIAGEKHDERTITVCKSCHSELSECQYLRDYRWGDINQSDAIKQAFFLWGLYDILQLKRDRTGISLYGQLARKLTHRIGQLIRIG